MGTVLSNFYMDFQQFAFSNSLIVNASGFAIGVATKEVIHSLFKLLGTPFVNWIIMQLKITTRVPKLVKRVTWQISAFLITIVCTFILLEYFLNRGVLKMKTVVDSQKYDSYIRSKAEAEEGVAIIPVTQEDLERVQQKQESERALIDKIIQKNVPGGNISIL